MKPTKIEKKILKQMNLEPTQKTINNLNNSDREKFNYLYFKKIGNKKNDYLHINEPGGNKKAFKFKNLLNWDFHDWKFQKKHNTKVSKKYKNLYLPGLSFVVIEKDNAFLNKRTLIYGRAQSAQSYITNNIFEKLQNYIKNNIYPYFYHIPYKGDILTKIPNSNFYKLNEKRAAGKEKELKKLEIFLTKELENIEKDVINQIKQLKKYTFRINEQEDENFCLFIIGGKQAAKEINFKTFLKDFYELEQPHEVLNIISKKIFKKYLKKIKKEHKKIESENKKWNT